MDFRRATRAAGASHSASLRSPESIKMGGSKEQKDRAASLGGSSKKECPDSGSSLAGRWM